MPVLAFKLLDFRRIVALISKLMFFFQFFNTVYQPPNTLALEEDADSIPVVERLLPLFHNFPPSSLRNRQEPHEIRNRKEGAQTEKEGWLQEVSFSAQQCVILSYLPFNHSVSSLLSLISGVNVMMVGQKIYILVSRLNLKSVEAMLLS